jgi:hypothetical protein
MTQNKSPHRRTATVIQYKTPESIKLEAETVTQHAMAEIAGFMQRMFSLEHSKSIVRKERCMHKRQSHFLARDYSQENARRVRQRERIEARKAL